MEWPGKASRMQGSCVGSRYRGRPKIRWRGVDVLTGEECLRQILQKDIKRNAAIDEDGSRLGCFEGAYDVRYAGVDTGTLHAVPVRGTSYGPIDNTD